MAKNRKDPLFVTKIIRVFRSLKHEIDDFVTNVDEIPPSKVYPSESDYERGWFYRYFTKRINDPNYFEIKKETYDSILNQEKKYDHNLYEIGKIKWDLKGNVFKKNALSLELTGRRWRNISYLFPILNEFQLPDIQDQENLYTYGEELYKADGTEYIGLYHIHKTMGPMEGPTHTEFPHPKLYYLDQLPDPRDMSYEDFLKEYPPPNVPAITPELATPTRGEETLNRSESYNCVAQWGVPPSGYTGFVNTNGQAPITTTCIDPGDGTGTFKYSDYASGVLSACESACDGTESFGIGCLIEFDPNYCPECQIPDYDLCTGNYTHDVDSFNPNQEDGWYTCFCGNYGGLPYYSQICCNSD